MLSKKKEKIVKMTNENKEEFLNSFDSPFGGFFFVLPSHLGLETVWDGVFHGRSLDTILPYFAASPLIMCFTLTLLAIFNLNLPHSKLLNHK